MTSSKKFNIIFNLEKTQWNAVVQGTQTQQAYSVRFKATRETRKKEGQRDL